MIKCPWCDTNFEHIDIMTGHLMRQITSHNDEEESRKINIDFFDKYRFHRMTLAAAKVVVAEQMKLQGRSSTELSLQFKQEIEQIEREFSDQTYWKVTQPKVYLHQLEHRTFGKISSSLSWNIRFSSFFYSRLLCLSYQCRKYRNSFSYFASNSIEHDEYDKTMLSMWISL